jgi:membrane protease YdiL (CAAX protease family)
MIFGVLYVRTSSLYTTIIIHAVNNAMAYSMICFGVGDISFSDMVGGGVVYYILYGVAVVIFVAASVEAYFKLKKLAANS